MRTYTNFEEIDNDLKVLQLKREIAFEELKGISYATKEHLLSPTEWIHPLIVKLTGKFGTLLMLKKMFFK